MISRLFWTNRRDGRSWLLVVENAQDASAQIWSEVLALVHDMEAARGFGAMLLVGPTELARKLATRPFASLASRLGRMPTCFPSISTRRANCSASMIECPRPTLTNSKDCTETRAETLAGCCGSGERGQNHRRSRPLNLDQPFRMLPATAHHPETAASEPAGDGVPAAVGSHVLGEPSPAFGESSSGGQTPAWTESTVVSSQPSSPEGRGGDGRGRLERELRSGIRGHAATEGEELSRPCRR